ncbi:hypothetical protein PIB30_046109, partial [Stylosanthes scabra]|nr:hypothetical protein [Stylosanthes scabra]
MDLLQRNWNVKLSHAYREPNTCADWMANWSVDHEFTTNIWSSPPPGIHQYLTSDARGALMLRY